MKSIAYYDGNIGSPDELTVPFNDRSHFFGDGVYDATMAANDTAFAIEDHLDRFFTSAATFDIKIPLGKGELAELLSDLIPRVEGETKFVYWQVTRGAAIREHVYDEDMTGTLWALVRQEDIPDPKQPLKLIAREDRRFAYGNVKTLNLMPAVKYSQEAHRAGADEAVLHRDGIVTECAHSNISILKNGTLYTHPNDEYILRGIAKTHLIQLCHRNSVPVVERAFTLDDLRDCDEAIVTSSGHFCVAACELDGRPIGGRDPKTFGALRRAVYREFVDYTGATGLFDL